MTGGQRALLEAVIRLGQTMGLQLVATGLETREQLDALRRLGCDLGEGPLFSQPIDAAGALEIAVEHQKALPPGV
jgi:EAL domain-containing protein (putative c-di-GMP-specific phosphodiesterase class I)